MKDPQWRESETESRFPYGIVSREQPGHHNKNSTRVIRARRGAGDGCRHDVVPLPGPVPSDRPRVSGTFVERGDRRVSERSTAQLPGEECGEQVAHHEREKKRLKKGLSDPTRAILNLFAFGAVVVALVLLSFLRYFLIASIAFHKPNICEVKLDKLSSFHLSDSTVSTAAIRNPSDCSDGATRR